MHILDCHIHLFTQKVIENVVNKTDMVHHLRLQTKGAQARSDVAALERDMQSGGVTSGLLLPTANAGGVKKVNRDSIQKAKKGKGLMSAGTLHPEFPENQQELRFLRDNNVRIIKLCSFSQGFVLDDVASLKMFEDIRTANAGNKRPFSVILDTFQQADYYFGASPAHITTPKKLGELPDYYPGINFIGAHMGGLGACIEDLCRYLTPRPNLFLDTSNASHTLDREDFIRLLHLHGPYHVLFGTDWPWFTQAGEVSRIYGLLDAAGFSEHEKQAVFYDNMAGLLGLEEK